MRTRTIDSLALLAALLFSYFVFGDGNSFERGLIYFAILLLEIWVGRNSRDMCGSKGELLLNAIIFSNLCQVSSCNSC